MQSSSSAVVNNVFVNNELKTFEKLLSERGIKVIQASLYDKKSNSLFIAEGNNIERKHVFIIQINAYSFEVIGKYVLNLKIKRNGKI